MEKTAFFSDVHGNLEALETVLDHMRDQDPDRVICLGDLVGYGARPVKVLDRIRRLTPDFLLRGNHDEALLNGAYGFNPVARRALEWTRDRIENESPAEQKEAALDLLRSTDPSESEEDRLYVHASPRRPLMEYILPSDCHSLIEEVPEKIRKNFQQVDRLCFFGHTHQPGIITEDGQYLRPGQMGGQKNLDPDQKYMVNPGSVGQPRDGNPNASYLVLENDTVTFHRVEYNISIAQERIRKEEVLDNRLASRLAKGK